MITDPLFYAVAVPALVVLGISKGGFGGGLGIIAVPSLSLVISPLQAVGIVLPILCLMDLFGVWNYRRDWSRRLTAYLAPGAALGIGIAALTADMVDETVIRLLIGMIAVAFALDFWLRRTTRESRRPENRVKGFLCAAASGFTSFVGHAGGPPLQVYLLPLRLDKTVFVATTVIFFMAVNYLKLVPYAYLGLLNEANLMTALVLSPICPLAMLFGIWLHSRVPERPFYAICYGFVLIVGLKLLYDGASELIA